MTINEALKDLNSILDGELLYDELSKSLYATDASVYRKIPLAVAYPKNMSDIRQLIYFAKHHKTSLIPRTAGTSLAGQCVGEGVVVDVSKHFTRILNVDETNRTVTVQPGVIRDELNNYLKPFGLFFGPNTSTSNRCMIGGMVGNNSSGTTSIKYGVTRDKVAKLNTLLSDGSEVLFERLTKDEFHNKCSLNTLEGQIYNTIHKELTPNVVQQNIRREYPNQEIHRRNTGYAIDELIGTEIFGGDKHFNMCELLSGSEGTLAFITEITLKLDLLPPTESVMVAAHFSSIENCLKAVVPAMKHDLYACEMMDKTILDCTKNNRTQYENRFFIEGDPQAILMCELKGNTKEAVNSSSEQLINTLKDSGLSYAYPVLMGENIDKALQLRSAGLGLLGNIIGDNKAVACIEDTAVTLSDLANYIEDFTELMKNFGQSAVYYAHAGAGELHLRPILNLKKTEDVNSFKEITKSVAELVKSYNGSFSGEHGDGILRSGFIEFMIGEENYTILKKIKTVFDSDSIFNPGKIINPYKMDDNLRYKVDRIEPAIDTVLNFEASHGILREAEKCNGSGDCRRLPSAGGTMCPSYRATLNEKDTTRARANALREFLTQSDKVNKFDYKELKQVFDLCLSCKACASECPSSVDVASLKAEFEYQYQKANGFSKQSRFFAEATKYNKIGSKVPMMANFVTQNRWLSKMIKAVYVIASERSLPKISAKSFSEIYNKRSTNNMSIEPKKTICLFVDEFTNYLESEIALDALMLLEKLGYDVVVLDALESGRSYISKGFLKESKVLINKNIKHINNTISSNIKIIGIEPSAILTFKDEALKLADDIEAAKQIANRSFLIDEFLYHEMKAGYIHAGQFTDEPQTLEFHGHCHQKALGNQEYTAELLGLPENYSVTVIPSGCCGMAGSFGYEKEHYNISMEVGEQTLFPAIRESDDKTIIVANGTSCRHQIKDGTQRIAKHPVTILRNALLI